MTNAPRKAARFVDRHILHMSLPVAVGLALMLVWWYAGYTWQVSVCIGIISWYATTVAVRQARRKQRQ